MTPIRLLIISEDYPRQESSAAYAFVHTRNKYYQTKGMYVRVLSFSAKETYSFDGIEVMPEKQVNPLEFDLFVFHAPNVRNHLRFIERNNILSERTILFFHGHEVLDVKADYPKPYRFNQKDSWRDMIRPVYDQIKFLAMKRFILKNSKSHLVFVSQWMYHRFLQNLHLSPEALCERISIIYNGISQAFVEQSFDASTVKDFDFVTIRGNLDDSKYAIDLVNLWATNNPNLKFLVVGRGDLFQYLDKASNLTLVEKTLNQPEIPQYLNQARCSLLPTRLDSQGVLACEIAAYGMPLITSDIEVCQEIFHDFKSVAVISNTSNGEELPELLEQVTAETIVETNDRYYPENTIGLEVELFQTIMRGLNDE